MDTRRLALDQRDRHLLALLLMDKIDDMTGTVNGLRWPVDQISDADLRRMRALLDRMSD